MVQQREDSLLRTILYGICAVAMVILLIETIVNLLLLLWSVPVVTVDGTRVGIDWPVRVTFSDDFDINSIKNGFSIEPNVSGEFFYSGKTLYFYPVNGLDYDTTYTVSVPTTIKRIDGASLKTGISWSFTTVKTPYKLETEFLNYTPKKLAFVDSNIEIVFSTLMKREQVERSFQLIESSSSSVVNGTFLWTINKMKFIPETALKPGLKYYVELPLNIKNIYGNGIDAYSLSSDEQITIKNNKLSWNFTVENRTQTVSATLFTANNTVHGEAPIGIAFNKNINKSSVESSITISPNFNRTYLWKGTNLYIQPQTPISPGSYFINISGTAKDALENPFNKNFSFSITIETPYISSKDFNVYSYGPVYPVTSLYITTPYFIKIAQLSGPSLIFWHYLMVTAILLSVGYVFLKEKETISDLKRLFTKLQAPDMNNPSSFFMTFQFYFTLIFFTEVYYLLVALAGQSPTVPDFQSQPVWYLFFGLAEASVYEELIVRVLFIGVPLLIIGLMFRYQQRKAYQYLLGGNLKFDLLTISLIIISSLIFGFAHYFGWDIFKVFQSFIGGLIFGYVYVKKGLHASIILHFIIDYTAMPIYVFGGSTLRIVSGLIILFFIVIGLIYFIFYSLKIFKWTMGIKEPEPVSQGVTVPGSVPSAQSNVPTFLPTLQRFNDQFSMSNLQKSVNLCRILPFILLFEL